MRHANLESILEQSIFKPEVAHFLKVAELKNISKAAESLGITQPQLSKSMAGLEYALGQTLFIRKSRGVELTSAGHSLIDRLSSLYKVFLESQKSGNIERVRIGFHPSIAMNVYPNVIHPLQAIESKFRIETQFGTSLDVTRKVAELELDFGFVINPQKNPDVVFKKLETDFVGAWTSGKNQSAKVLYYHPDMFNIQRILKRFSGFRKIPLSDYEVIGEVLSLKKDAVGILPQNIARRYDLTLFKDEKLLTVEMVLIAHREKLKTVAFKSLFVQMQDLFFKRDESPNADFIQKNHRS